MKRCSHKTQLGKYYLGDCVELLKGELGEKLEGKVQLILTSPPFPLNTKKKYGNKEGNEYLSWFANLASVFSKLLTKDGSIVIELGNAWEKGRPVQSLLTLQSLLAFLEHEEADLRLCQEFCCYNPSRLPSPAQWVTIERIRLTDSYTHVWWMAKSDYPKADNRRVLRPYSADMEKLLKNGRYNSSRRPSNHQISENGFLKDNGGSISHNFFELELMEGNKELRLPNAFRISNSQSNDYFLKRCRECGITPHPARMPEGLAAIFLEMLTDEEDLVLDPFAGSNTTGYVSESLGREWVSIEVKQEYAKQSRIRLSNPKLAVE